jgi:sterol-4alpha-carboxylate 3-dehydrogenase (decarboxylating)
MVVQQQRVLVIGGAGFLGQAIVKQLLDKGYYVKVFDIVAPQTDIPFVIGDITDQTQIAEALVDIDVVIHTASPIHGKPASVYFKVNVEGTRNVISCCLEAKVCKLIYTSSASVIYDGSDLINADETVPYCSVHMDAYNETKAIAEEMVLKANSSNFHTCALRPSGIFGPKDSQGSLAIVEAAKKGQSKVMIGNNESLFDLTYVDNVAYAHLLALEKLSDEKVQGQVFIITNDQPIFFWDYPKVLLHELGYRNTQSIKLGNSFASFLADVMSLIPGYEPSLTRFRIKIIQSNRYFNISKAKEILGYKPIVPLMEGIRLTAEYWKEMGCGNKN